MRAGKLPGATAAAAMTSGASASAAAIAARRIGDIAVALGPETATAVTRLAVPAVPGRTVPKPLPGTSLTLMHREFRNRTRWRRLTIGARQRRANELPVRQPHAAATFLSSPDGLRFSVSRSRGDHGGRHRSGGDRNLCRWRFGRRRLPRDDELTA